MKGERGEGGDVGADSGVGDDDAVAAIITILLFVLDTHLFIYQSIYLSMCLANYLILYLPTYSCI